MKGVCNIVNAAIFMLMASVCAEAMAQENVTMVDFEHLGEPLNLKKLGVRERNILEKMQVTIEDDSDALYASINRVVRIAGANGPFVLVEEHLPWGAGDKFTIQNIVSLESWKKFSLHLPNNSPLKDNGAAQTAALFGLPPPVNLPESLITHYQGSDSTTFTRYIKNEKGELVSMIWVGHYVKSFKGKKSCSNKGAILDIDGNSLSIRVRVGSKNLGTDCSPIYPEGVYGDKYAKAISEFEAKDKAFYEKLFLKILAN